jgi:hypothetical protein
VLRQQAYLYGHRGEGHGKGKSTTKLMTRN